MNGNNITKGSLKINLHFKESKHPHGKARGGRIAGYLTDEQHSHMGCIGLSKREVIFEGALSFAVLIIL